MKKLVLVSLKTFAFFVGWAICASILPIPDTKVRQSGDFGQN